MLTNLKTITLLMLLAGVSLGVFAGTLIAAGDPGPEPSPFSERAKAFQELYGLTPEQTADVERELERHRQRIYDVLLELRRDNQDRFSEVIDDTENRIRAIIEGANRGDSNR